MTKDVTILVAAMAVACSGPHAITLEGRWTEPVPGMEQLTQGIELLPDGQAASINMATLVYKAWRVSGDTLMVAGQSIGNGQTIDFVDTLRVLRLSSDSLILSRSDNNLVRYVREDK